MKKHYHEYETIRRCSCGKEITPAKEYKIIVDKIIHDENYNTTKKLNVGNLHE